LLSSAGNGFFFKEYHFLTINQTNMKNIIAGICTLVLISGVAFSADKKSEHKKATVKKECKATKACCKDKGACKPGTACMPACKAK
jgi:hypothetical protein